MSNQARRRRRQGNILVLSCFMMIGMLAMVAFSVDLGYYLTAKTQLQRAADSAAIAAAWDLIDEDGPQGSPDLSQSESQARSTVQQYAQLNSVLNSDLEVAASDIRVGYLSDPTDPTATMDLSNSMPHNAVHVTLRRSADVNGQVPFLFGSILGTDSAAAQAEATAALLYNFRGFRIPSDGSNLGILPFAVDLESWNDLLYGHGSDQWTWNSSENQIESGSDGILEINLYPQGTGSPGNRGTTDIGGSNNSTADISRQILEGLSPEDLEYHGGSLEFDENGEIVLNADTGISAGVKDELSAIKGEPRIIPVFSELSGNGNNASYTIVHFAGVRVMDVKLTGKMRSKRVIIQPANVVSAGAIPSTSGQFSYFIYSTVWLCR